MKGQMVFEFVIAAVVFFGIVLYVINYLNTEMVTYSSDYFTNELESKAVQISELLVHNPGEWESLPVGNAWVLGLAAEEWPVLDDEKISNLGLLCKEDYDGVLELLDMEVSTPYGRRLMKAMINITEVGTESVIMECGYEPVDVTFVSINRFAVTENGKTVKMAVAVWA
jgi:hypothetical protein